MGNKRHRARQKDKIGMEMEAGENGTGDGGEYLKEVQREGYIINRMSRQEGDFWLVRLRRFRANGSGVCR